MRISPLLTIATASSALLLGGCGGQLLAKALTGGSVEGLDKRIDTAYAEFDAGNYAAAARDCADAYADMQGKFNNSLLDRNSPTNQATYRKLGTCAADANWMLERKKEACKWYARVDFATLASNFDPRHYCSG